MNNAFTFLLNQTKDQERQALLALIKARSELDNYYDQVAQIEKYRLDYCNQLVQRGSTGLSASEYGHLNRFLTQLDETLSKQKKAESHFKMQVDNCEEHWQKMRQNRKSYQWMIDKKEQENILKLAKQEQKQMDEFANLQYARKISNYLA